jgi:hypothetical protein
LIPKPNLVPKVVRLHIEVSTSKMGMHLEIMGILHLHSHTLIIHLKNMYEPCHAFTSFLIHLSYFALNLIASSKLR